MKYNLADDPFDGLGNIRTYSSAKAAHVIAYLALKTRDRSLDVLKAIKLVYLADRENILRYALPILDEPRAALPQGPVNSRTYDRVKGEVEASDPAWSAILSDRANHRIAVKDTVVEADLDELSDAEIETLDAVWERFGHMSQWQLVKWTHQTENVPEWKDPNGSSTPISLQSIMEAVGIEGAAEHARFVNDIAVIRQNYSARV